MFHVKRRVRRVVERQLEEWGIRISAAQLERLGVYSELLAGYRKANVIGTRDPEVILLEHVLDSLSCLLFRPLSRARRVVDVGSGGGLPGIPLKIALPDVRMALVEATGKKAGFLEEAVLGLGLSGVEVINKRVEEVGRDIEHRSAYDAAVQGGCCATDASRVLRASGPCRGARRGYERTDRGRRASPR